MTIDTSQLKVSTKWIASAFLAVGGFMTIPAVNGVVTPLLAAHPRLAPVVSALVGIYVLLHNPQVVQALGIKQTVEVKETTEMVSIPEPSEAAK